MLLHQQPKTPPKAPPSWYQSMSMLMTWPLWQTLQMLLWNPLRTPPQTPPSLRIPLRAPQGCSPTMCSTAQLLLLWLLWKIWRWSSPWPCYGWCQYAQPLFYTTLICWRPTTDPRRWAPNSPPRNPLPWVLLWQAWAGGCNSPQLVPQDPPLLAPVIILTSANNMNPSMNEAPVPAPWPHYCMVMAQAMAGSLSHPFPHALHKPQLPWGLNIPRYLTASARQHYSPPLVGGRLSI